ncbi:MAG TPA: zinc dependent phospholipase C family protein [Candidatus Ozemobacteraceae bacterium]|nr:zinc dependent phospholipase C family protein [Candidatus Ozemobacteraceae bacterium]
MRTRTIALAALLLVPLLLAATSAEAWGGRTHKKITSDAYFIMPSAFREFLGATGTGPSAKHPAFKALLEASIEPDTTLKDFRNHVFHIHGSDMGNGPFKVEELVKEVVEDIKAKKSRASIVRKLGWICHYTADLVQPLHTGIVVVDGIEEKPYHAACEKDINDNVHLFGVSFEGCRSVDRVSALMVYWSLWANKYYDALIQYYTPGNQDKKRGRMVSATCYSRAVNDVVLMWYTIWARSGGKIDPRKDGKPKYFPPAGNKNELALPVSREIEELDPATPAEPPAQE